MVAPKQTKQAVTRKAHEVVADQIRQQIVEGVLVEGQRLPPEDDLTVQFGVARTTLREALRVLESQGLLDDPPWPWWWTRRDASRSRSDLDGARVSCCSCRARRSAISTPPAR